MNQHASWSLPKSNTLSRRMNVTFGRTPEAIVSFAETELQNWCYVDLGLASGITDNVRNSRSRSLVNWNDVHLSHCLADLDGIGSTRQSRFFRVP